ncbi:hypothetical protein CVIRNUC_001089 [Coccomyxa viridis]|uniref:RING-CH-type domain-containing protein n=1 Tax=Coccomyxa viridis TaxID=1274662 RepID=A0AAV1HTS7_9CHLO|nr:hypothetical protein CVIRNUC_001089 [Coccomyxa viridis]
MQQFAPPLVESDLKEIKTCLKRPRAQNDIQVFSGNTSFSDGQTVHQAEDVPICWICLDTARPDAGLVTPCACPRQAHAQCLARWQLQSAGSRKETHCEFCDRELPDWKSTLTPQCGANAPAVMNVNFDGRTYSFEVKPGPEGYREFTQAIRRAFNLPEDSELNITFTCDEPSAAAEAEPMSPVLLPAVPIQAQPPPPTIHDTTPMAAPTLMHQNSLLTLQGAGAYDAAVHCASVSAARRIMSHRGDTPTHAGSSSRQPFDPQHHPNTPRAVQPRTPTSPISGGAASSSSTTENQLQKNKRLSGFGRKLRSALCEFLTIKSPPQ